jgi:hypothetical protein
MADQLVWPTTGPRSHPSVQTFHWVIAQFGAAWEIFKIGPWVPSDDDAAVVLGLLRKGHSPVDLVLAALDGAFVHDGFDWPKIAAQFDAHRSNGRHMLRILNREWFADLADGDGYADVISRVQTHLQKAVGDTAEEQQLRNSLKLFPSCVATPPSRTCWKWASVLLENSSLIHKRHTLARDDRSPMSLAPSDGRALRSTSKRRLGASGTRALFRDRYLCVSAKARR